MNILLVTQFHIPHSGGLSAHVQDLMLSLKSLGHSSLLIEGKMVEPSKFHKIFNLLWSGGRNDKYRIIRLDGSISKLTNMISDELNTHRYDLVHCHDPVAAYASQIAIAKIKSDVPVIETVHGPLTYESKMMLGAEIENNPYLRMLLQIEQQAYSKSKRIMAVDTGQARIVIEDFKQNCRKVSIVFNAVNVKVLREIADVAPATTYPEPFVLVPRRLVPKTGVHIAIKALQLVCSRGHNINLVIAGEGPLRGELEKMSKDLGIEDKVTFAGSLPREQILRLAKRALVVLVPSIPSSGVIEATSIAALEAMACGTPVIASNIGGLAEILRDGETGLLVQHSNEHALAEAIEKLFNPATRNRIGANGYAYALENMDTSKWVLKILDNYKLALR